MNFTKSRLNNYQETYKKEEKETDNWLHQVHT